MLISRVLLSTGVISILGAIFNVVCVAYFIRSQLNLFPVQLILSPILALIGAASLTTFSNRANFSSSAHREGNEIDDFLTTALSQLIFR